MKTRKLLILSGLFISTVVIGQSFHLGPRVGISSSRIQVEESFNYNGDDVTYETEGSKLGFHIGAYTRLSIAAFFLQPELLYTSAGGKIVVGSGNNGKEVEDLTYNKLDLPVLVGTKLAGVLRLEAGPVFSLILSNDARKINALEEASQNHEDATIGYQAGIGLDIGKIIIDLKYEGSLSNMGNSLQIGDQEFDTDFRNSLLMVVVGLNLF
jgi:hypothetical protein